MEERLFALSARKADIERAVMDIRRIYYGEENHVNRRVSRLERQKLSHSEKETRRNEIDSEWAVRSQQLLARIENKDEELARVNSRIANLQAQYNRRR